jgi:hypothetical protein
VRAVGEAARGLGEGLRLWSARAWRPRSEAAI